MDGVRQLPRKEVVQPELQGTASLGYHFVPGREVTLDAYFIAAQG